MPKPKRIQRKRTKGWRMPANTVYVGRPSQWENTFPVTDDVSPEQAVMRFKVHLASYFGFVDRQRQKLGMSKINGDLEDWIKPLKGKNLACWCPLDQPCHADLLLEIANPVSLLDKH